MPLTREQLLAMEIDIKEIEDIIDAGQMKMVFGIKSEDLFICDTMNQQRTLVRNLLEQVVDEQQHEPNTPSFGWSSVRSTARRFFGYRSNDEADEVEFAQAAIQRSRQKTQTVSRIRKNHIEVFALAVCGVFLRTYQSEEDCTLAHVWNKRYARASRLSTREQVQESAEKLRLLSRRVASIIEFPENSSLMSCVGKSVIGKDLIQRVSNLFTRTLELFLDYPRASFVDGVIQQAERAIDDTLRHFHTPTRLAGSANVIAAEHEVVSARIADWEHANNNFYESLEELQMLSESEQLALLREEDTIVEEVSAWNTLVSSARGASMTTSNVKQIVAEAFTYSNINPKIPSVLGLEVLFNGKPHSKAKPYVAHGGYGQVYRIDLPIPLSIEVDLDGSQSSTRRIEWTVSKVAVKVQGQLSGAPAKAHYSSENARCARIVRELRIWSKMKHENILPLFGVWIDFGERNANYPVPVSPWMDDGDLLCYLQTQKELEMIDKLKILCDVASAMVYLHGKQHPVVHGDLKSTNILIRNRRAYLTDFGISAILDEVSGQSSAVHANVRWAAPELIRQLTDKPQKVTCESDIYSFGCVVLETLTSDVPWTSNIAPGRLLSIRLKNPGSLPAIPDTIRPKSSLWELMRKCWRLEPLLRPTASQAFTVIHDLMNENAAL